MRHLLISLLLLAALSACDRADAKALTDAGSASLNSGDAKGAVASFDEALAQLKPGDTDFLRASIGRCQALARTDPQRAEADFLALAQSQPSRVREPEFVDVATELAKRGAIGPATTVAEEGLKRFPESPAIKALLDTVGDAAKQAGDPESLKKLKGMGYVGDG
jgi:hypothetical protein